MRAAPPIGYNLTYVCPPGMVWDHDWFAVPFIMMTCQESGVFDEPDWSELLCVHRKLKKIKLIINHLVTSSHNH